jgi:hypothetical protein
MEAESMNNRDEGRLQLAQVSEAYWRVTLNFPALNTFGLMNIPQPEKTAWPLESDDRVKVVVFDCAVDEFLSESL